PCSIESYVQKTTEAIMRIMRARRNSPAHVLTERSVCAHTRQFSAAAHLSSQVAVPQQLTPKHAHPRVCALCAPRSDGVAVKPAGSAAMIHQIAKERHAAVRGEVQPSRELYQLYI
ncbi:MAG TPA: hypothetical protein VFB80_20145, partial [Pirellulaceae bacterium]|nr:hypothetical protein [Pirellulaceae bacterium]